MEECNSFQDCSKFQLLVMVKNGYRIMDCNTCLRRFAVINNTADHLSRVYDDDYFFDGKSEYANYLDDKDILFKYGVRYSKIVGKYTNPGKILDVGCAAGFILKGFTSNGWTGEGIEPNATMAAYGKKELNMDIHVGSLEDFKTDQKYDLITMIQVIGHFFDMNKSMENISHLLNKNGLVVVESWNMKSLVARIFGKNWHEYSPPGVINWFSDESLKKMFETHGFVLIDSGYPIKKIKLKHALSIIRKRVPDFWFKDKIFSFLSGLLGKLVLIYPPFDLKWYIFKKS